MDAKLKLQGIIKLWSGSDAPHPSFEQLDIWKDLDPSQLSNEELERLGVQYFNGSDRISRDRVRAVQLWTLAASKGSWQAAFR